MQLILHLSQHSSKRSLFWLSTQALPTTYSLVYHSEEGLTPSLLSGSSRELTTGPVNQTDRPWMAAQGEGLKG